MDLGNQQNQKKATDAHSVTTNKSCDMAVGQIMVRSL